MPNSFLSLSVALLCILSGSSVIYSEYFSEQDILMNNNRDMSTNEKSENRLINQNLQESKSILRTTETIDWHQSMLSTAQTVKPDASAELNAIIIDIDVILDADNPQTIENNDLEIENAEVAEVGDYIDVDDFLAQVNSSNAVTEVGEYIDVDNPLLHINYSNDVSEVGGYIDVDNPMVQDNYSNEVTEIGEFINADNVDGVNVFSDTKRPVDYPQA